MKKYRVYYKLDNNEQEEREIVLSAKSKEDAFTIAWYQEIPRTAGSFPAFARVGSIIYGTGREVPVKGCREDLAV